MRLVVITPMRDEAARLGRVIEAVRAQERRPDRWLIVDDGSTDGSAELAREQAQGEGWIEVLRAPAFQRGGADRLAAAAEARAFLWALERHVEPGEWDLLGKLDADVVLLPRHYARIVAAFEADPRLGIAGCFLEEERGGRRVTARMPAFHVNGALKVWRRSCWEQIGGIEARLAWDTIDETYARMHGWHTLSLGDLRALHLRTSGSAGGALRGRARHGECVWILHYPPATVAGRTLLNLRERPYVLAGLAYLGGWLRAALSRRARVADPRFRAHVRAEQRARLRARLRSR